MNSLRNMCFFFFKPDPSWLCNYSFLVYVLSKISKRIVSSVVMVKPSRKVSTQIVSGGIFLSPLVYIPKNPFQTQSPFLSVAVSSPTPNSQPQCPNFLPDWLHEPFFLLLLLLLSLLPLLFGEVFCSSVKHPEAKEKRVRKSQQLGGIQWGHLTTLLGQQPMALTVW